MLYIRAYPENKFEACLSKKLLDRVQRDPKSEEKQDPKTEPEPVSVSEPESETD
jgi:hypothetical protein